MVVTGATLQTVVWAMIGRIDMGCAPRLHHLWKVIKTRRPLTVMCEMGRAEVGAYVADEDDGGNVSLPEPRRA